MYRFRFWYKNKCKYVGFGVFFLNIPQILLSANMLALGSFFKHTPGSIKCKYVGLGVFF